MRDVIEIEVDRLTTLLNYRKEYFKLCDLFNIPPDIRDYPNAGDNIIERIKTYQTGYILRKSAAEKELNTAFEELPPVLPVNMDLTDGK